MSEPDTTNIRRADLRRADLRRPWRQSAIALVLVGGGFALGAASLATAHGDLGGGMGGWHHHHGPRIGHFQRMVHGALDNVGASTAQEDKVHDIIAKASTDLEKGSDERDAIRTQVLALMKAPTLDRAAFDKLRADRVAAMDAKSKVIEDAVFEAASQLTPEQRAKLAADVEAHMDGGWGGWHRRGHGDGGRTNGERRGGDHHGDDGAPDHG